MDEHISCAVMCCFCGKEMNYSKAVLLTVRPDAETLESQQLFCHKKCLVNAVTSSVVLHPDFSD
jgi:hypothetical protein